MTLYDNLVFYYLTCKQKFVNYYNILIINAIGFNEIRILTNNQQQNAIPNFLFYILATKLVNFFDYIKNKSIMLRSKIDISADKLQLTKITNKGERTIILDNELNNAKITFDDVSTHLALVQPDDTMMTCIFLNFELINSENDKICLKNFIMKYKDLDEKYHQTLKNILIFNNINHTENSTLNIKLAKNRKIMTFNMLVKDISDKHINYFTKLNQ